MMMDAVGFRGVRRAFILWCLACIAAPAAFAAPYCVSVQGIPDQCLYVDPHECQQRAQALGGSCAANSAELVTPAGPGAYCVVDSGRAALCMFNNRDECERDARRRRGACVQASTPVQPGVDPFAIRRPF